MSAAIFTNTNGFGQNNTTVLQAAIGGYTDESYTNAKKRKIIEKNNFMNV